MRNQSPNAHTYTFFFFCLKTNLPGCMLLWPEYLLVRRTNGANTLIHTGFLLFREHAPYITTCFIAMYIFNNIWPLQLTRHGSERWEPTPLVTHNTHTPLVMLHWQLCSHPFSVSFIIYGSWLWTRGGVYPQLVTSQSQGRQTMFDIKTNRQLRVFISHHVFGGTGVYQYEVLFRANARPFFKVSILST